MIEKLPSSRREDAVAEESEIAGVGDVGAQTSRLAAAGKQAIVTRVVENAGWGFFGRNVDAVLGEPIGDLAVASRSVDDDVRGQNLFAAVAVDPHAARPQNARLGRGEDKAAHFGFGEEAHARQTRGVAAQDRLEGRAPARENAEVGVVRHGTVNVAQRRREAVAEAQLARNPRP